jgi:hypothetical protein
MQIPPFLASVVARARGGSSLCPWVGCLLLLGGSLTALGAPLDQWHWRCPDATGNRLNAVASGGERYVAVGDLGSIIVSDGAQIWELADSMVLVSLRDVVWGGDVWIAVGDFGTILSSPDGMTWSLRSTGYYYDLLGVTWGNGVFVAVGANSSILTSTDGEQWTLRTTGTHPLQAVAWGDGQFVAVGGEPPVTSNFGRVGGKPLVLTSNDGSEWARQEVTVNGQLTCVAYGGGRFLAGSTSGQAAVSMDAMQWLGSSIVLPYQRWETQSVQWVGDEFWATVGASTSQLMGYYRSQDGVSWIFQGWEIENGPNSGYIVDMTVGMAGVVGVTHGLSGIGGGPYYGHTVLGTTDGRLWRVLNRELPDFEIAVTFAGDRFFVRETARYAHYESQPETIYLTSLDGRFWESILASPNERFGLPAYGQGWWVAGGEGGRILVSTNAMQWSRAQTQVSNSLVWSSYAGDRFFLTGSEGVLLTSPNVVVWTREHVDTTRSLGPVEWSGGTWVVAEGEAPVIWASTDAKQWIRGNLPASVVAVQSVKGWEEGFHALVTLGPYWTPALLRSTDGFHWELEPAPGLNPSLLTTGGEQMLVFQGDGGRAHARGVGASNWSTHSLPWMSSQGLAFYGGPVGAAFGHDTFVVIRYRQMLQSEPLVERAPWLAKPLEVVAVSTNAEVTLHAMASGSSPLRYQWRRNGIDLEGVTRPSLTVVAEELMTGAFTVRVENAAGSTESEPATVVFGTPARLEMGPDLSAVYVWGTPGGRYRVEESGLAPGADWSVVSAYELPTTGGPMRVKVPWRSQWPRDQHWFYRAVLVP